MNRIGIPRALVYYEYIAMWKAFFNSLGMEVVVSPPTTRAMVQAGTQRMVAETCLPVKVCAGHLVYLRDQGVDRVLIPAVTATEPGLFQCSKFLDLPHLMRAVVEDLPPLLEMDIDLDGRRHDLPEAMTQVARSLAGRSEPGRQAVEAACDAHARHADRLRRAATAADVEIVHGSLDPAPVALELPASRRDAGVQDDLPDDCGGIGRPTVGMAGHPYLRYDAYVNHNVLDRLRRLGARILLPEMIPADSVEMAIRRLTGSKYWVYEGEVTGAAGAFLARDDVDGVIALVAFGCGPDSSMMDVVQRMARRLHKPLLTLVLDEHTGEAGLLTRLEAFVDLVVRRGRGVSPVAF